MVFFSSRVQVEETLFKIGFNPQMNVKIFFHTKEDEVWLKAGAFPYSVASAKLDIKVQTCKKMSNSLLSILTAQKIVEKTM